MVFFVMVLLHVNPFSVIQDHDIPNNLFFGSGATLALNGLSAALLEIGQSAGGDDEVDDADILDDGAVTRGRVVELPPYEADDAGDGARRVCRPE